MSVLLTHIRPHVDDICGLWLLERFNPDFINAEHAYVPSEQAVAWLEQHPQATAVGVGRGQFDEHKGDRADCAATLVWKSVRANIASEIDQRAIDRLVEWVFKGDTGQFVGDAQADFSLAAIVRGSYAVANGDSDTARALGYQALDALLVVQRQIVQLEQDWSNHQEFASSKYGLIAAMTSSAEGAESYAYRFGFDLAITINHEHTYFNIRANAKSNLDLTTIHQALKSADPNADWFFHHSNKMLICGGYLAPNARPSQLGLDDLVRLVQSN